MSEQAGRSGSWQAALDRRFAEDIVWAGWAVTRWEGFPVDRQPRPLVLVGQRAFVERGFATGEAKLAYVGGHISSAVPVPGAVLAALPRTRRTGASGRLGSPLLITEAARGETEFVTDRGRRQLPAWRLSANDALGPIWVLDPDVELSEWQPAEPPAVPPPTLRTPRNDPGAHVDVGANEVTVTLHFTGAPPEYEDYPHAEVIESPKAVAIIPKSVDVGPPGIRRALGCGRQVTVHLTAPLGQRVFVDLHGNPRQALTPSLNPAQGGGAHNGANAPCPH